MEQPAAVVALRDDPAVAFAAQELGRYLAQIGGSVSGAPMPPPSPPSPPDAARNGGGFRLGTFGDFDRLGAAARAWPAAGNPELDDAVFIEARGLSGTIAGSNPRSVLLAVYRYLWELGCRWVRPGADGEYVPQADLRGAAVRVAEVAAYRHRGICIEGAVSYEHVRDMVDWAPKLGFNSYFVQFREAYTFFERWYAHRGNPLQQPEPFSVEQARALKARLAAEITRRGLVFHDVGHGWTCEPFGLPGLGWEYDPPPLLPGVERYLAEIGGARTLFRGVPLNTNLCYSNPEVRATVVEDVVRYAREHPEVDVIHFWLADGSNNHCECERCRQALPSDWYVRMLNELDARLAAGGLGVRIVFLIYVDLLWPPETERIANPDRFILMFAPITRTYSKAFAPEVAEALLPPLPPFERNKLQFPRSVEGNLAFLRAWQQRFRGDSFDFDYHLMWDHYRDPGYVAVAEVVHQDVRNLGQIGLNGLVSCQVQRACFPTGLPMVVMGRTLWRTEHDFEALARDYFDAAFGADGGPCLAYCRELSALFDPPYLRGEKPTDDPAAAAAFARIPEVIAGFRPIVERNLGVADACRAQSWRYVDAHAELCLQLAEALRRRAQGQDAAARQAWLSVQRAAQEREDELHPVLDVYEFTRVLGRLFRE